MRDLQESIHALVESHSTYIGNHSNIVEPEFVSDALAIAQDVTNSLHRDAVRYYDPMELDNLFQEARNQDDAIWDSEDQSLETRSHGPVTVRGEGRRAVDRENYPLAENASEERRDKGLQVQCLRMNHVESLPGANDFAEGVACEEDVAQSRWRGVARRFDHHHTAIVIEKMLGKISDKQPDPRHSSHRIGSRENDPHDLHYRKQRR